MKTSIKYCFGKGEYFIWVSVSDAMPVAAQEIKAMATQTKRGLVNVSRQD
jgi:hypothetical protein